MTEQEFFNLILTSAPGSLGEIKNTFCYFPEYNFSYDENGNIETVDYLCSYIVCARKYDDTRFNIAYINLDHSYNGKKIDINDDKYEWLYSPMTFNDLKDIQITDNFRDLIDRE